MRVVCYGGLLHPPHCCNYKPTHSFDQSAYTPPTVSKPEPTCAHTCMPKCVCLWVCVCGSSGVWRWFVCWCVCVCLCFVVFVLFCVGVYRGAVSVCVCVCVCVCIEEQS